MRYQQKGDSGPITAPEESSALSKPNAFPVENGLTNSDKSASLGGPLAPLPIHAPTLNKNTSTRFVAKPIAGIKIPVARYPR